ncbi:unnamed protein product [Dicrocoelium dendriticum]|nr:unnamed protein product [Dicrocoelium dendriticum]CAI2737812.1 unnamed protein product [Dicrocoelium dendriticum]CAI2737813.1 unnamed protein product [Dicrocoelium dendriticum]
MKRPYKRRPYLISGMAEQATDLVALARETNAQATNPGGSEDVDFAHQAADGTNTLVDVVKEEITEQTDPGVDRASGGCF